MPKSQRSGAARAPKNFDPRYGQRKKAGSIGKTHRGYRSAEEGGERKARWSDTERAGRAQGREISESQRSSRAGAPRTERSDRGGDRREFNRGERPERGARREWAPSDRADRGGDRRDFNRGERNERPERGARREWAPSDRADRGGDRRDFNRGERNERGARREWAPNDRADRGGDRRDFNRGERNERPERSNRREWAPADRTERAARPQQGRRNDRPRNDRNDRDDRAGRARGSRNDWNLDGKARENTQRDDVVHERLQAQVITQDETADVTFESLGLGDNIVRQLAALGAERPFPIQAATIPVILEGRDTLGRGRTGSGKTIAFGAPLVERILRSKSGKRREFGRAPSALILAPTRELALQIDRTIQPIARSVGLFTTQVYGGVPQGRQVGALRKGVDIVIGTAGRIEDLHAQGKLDLSEVQVTVLDEADHMAELGFLEPMQRILRLVGDDSQKLLFSATLDREVEALVNEFLQKPAVFEVGGEDQDSGTIDHRVLVIEHRDKPEILTSLVDREGKTVVFTRTRAYAEMLAEQFENAGINAVSLHGDLNQAKRTRNLQKLTSGRASVLVATDVAARGIHVDDVDLVIQADAPDEYKTYLHRAGRTGRAGKAGTVVTLIPRARRRRMNEMLERAEIIAPFMEAAPGDDVIDEVTGRSLTVEALTQ